eukprot:157903-Pyramimonas_sp.AAC.1
MEVIALGEPQLEGLKTTLAEADARRRARSNADWRSWLTAGLEKGAKRAHLITKDPSPWRPTTTLAADGSAVADPLSLLANEGDKFSSFWGQASGEAKSVTLVQAFPRATPDQLRAVSK